MGQFEFPVFHSFPPSYTLQPNAATRTKQIKMWGDLIKDYCRAKKQFVIVVAEWCEKSELFNNKQISRKLSPQMANLIVNELVVSGFAVWKDANKSSALVFWRSVDDWAEYLASWVNDNGLKGTVCTLYELSEGDGVKNTELEGLPQEVVLLACQSLERQKKAIIFQSDNSQAQGVKFI